jgi:serine phosphatase RsbU (regulator of sigma subunit)
MTAPVTAGSSPAARLLVVDDVADNRDLLARRLARLGHEVTAVASGAEALAHVAREPTDLVLLDVMMPGMSGDEVLAQLKRDPAVAHIPVLMISALGDLERVARCIELGAADYLSKPFEPVLLRARVAACLAAKRVHDAERGVTQRLTHELEVGREIQRGFLPATLPEFMGCELAATFEGAREVSGDFYDAFPSADGTQLTLVVGDVCGKGVGAALFMALFRSLIRAVATRAMRSGATMVGSSDERLMIALTTANDYIAREHGSANMFATVFAGSLNTLSGVVRYVNAGHEPPLVIAAAGGVREQLPPTGPALGLFPDAPLAMKSVRLAMGETLLVATDGVSEARDRSGGFFGEPQLLSLCAAPAPTAAALVARVRDAVHAFADGAEPADDLTMLAARRVPPTF